MPSRKQLEQQYIEDRAFWGSISARWRGLAGGIIVGALCGAAVGLAGAGIFSAVSGVALAEMGKATVLGLVAFFTGAGMLTGATMWSGAGQVAGAVAAGLTAQKELDMIKGKGLSQEIDIEGAPQTTPKPPLFNWKVMGIGALVTGAIGAFLAYSGAMPPGASHAMLGQTMGTGEAALAAACVMGTFGAVFGVGFKVWGGIKKFSDGLFESRVTGRSTPMMEQLKDKLLETQQPERKVSITLMMEPKKVLVAQGPISEKVLSDRSSMVNIEKSSVL